jgi:hypothetical protein
MRAGADLGGAAGAYDPAVSWLMGQVLGGVDGSRAGSPAPPRPTLARRGEITAPLQKLLYGTYATPSTDVHSLGIHPQVASHT